MRLTKIDLDFINEIIRIGGKKITPSDFSNLKASQLSYKVEKINSLLNLMNKTIIKKRYSNFYIHSIIMG